MSSSAHCFGTNFLGRLKSPICSSNAEQDDHHLPKFEPFGEAVAVPRGPSSDAALKCVSVDMMQNENKRDHHCHLYEGKNNILIIRRAQEFKMNLHFNQPVKPSDKFQIEFYIGIDTNVLNGTKIIISFDSSRNGKWTGRMIQKLGDKCVVGITPSASAIIGKYYTNVAVIGSNGISRTPKDPRTDFYLLFNAWAFKDEVYIPNEQDRQEYVMNENGCIYQVESGGGRQWFYGQFGEGILDACFQILDNSHMPLVNRGDVVKVCRIGAAMMNSQDDQGVLVGNWSDDYSLGTAPTFWIGSDQILLQYANQGPVSYAQCWVYAGTLNTLLRCLGIPARVITNFNSAHDNTGNIITDLIFNSVGNRLELNERLTRDSIWNYHCWNEAYMSRPDLPAIHDLGGWQVVDATPQETSDGYYRCGPCSVKAIKKGMLGYQFDAPFVFAEVNSNVHHHKLDTRTGRTELQQVDTTYIGKKVVTKSVGGNNYEPMDITQTYKYPEGSDKDKETMKKAERTYKLRMQDDDEQEIPEANVEMTLETPVEPVMIGHDFQMAVVFRNLSEDTRTIHGFLVGSTVYYTNIQRAQFKQESFDVTLNPMDTSRVQVGVLAQKYMPQLGCLSNLRFVVTAKSMENNQDMTAMQIVNLEGPELVFSMSGPAQVNQEVVVKVEFTNPLPFSLRDVRMAMQGPNFMAYREKLYSEIATGASITWMESFVPTRSVNTMIYAVLDCSVLGNVQGNWAICIQA
ncbi:coagulation factor XIII A chain-like [Coregonus clupeaformis]|uniref:coagulation factor XIII A chain-like n=1 Tax=Coregonus clupeaformis TaxID=59861 RepID=UPI001E1C8127|nr:coagulation factor XIII A chain-like [Coregonus clupeaformis]